MCGAGLLAARLGKGRHPWGGRPEDPPGSRVLATLSFTQEISVKVCLFVFFLVLSRVLQKVYDPELLLGRYQEID